MHDLHPGTNDCDEYCNRRNQSKEFVLIHNNVFNIKNPAKNGIINSLFTIDHS